MLEVSKDGRTAYERRTGKKANALGLEFAEKLLWELRPQSAHQEKMSARWRYGLFLGVRRQSGELIAMDPESKKVKYVRTARRTPAERRCDAANLEWTRAVPWNLRNEDDEADEEMPEFDFRHGPRIRLTAGEMEEIKSRGDPKILHKAHLRRTNFKSAGPRTGAEDVQRYSEDYACSTNEEALGGGRTRQEC